MIESQVFRIGDMVTPKRGVSAVHHPYSTGWGVIYQGEVGIVVKVNKNYVFIDDVRGNQVVRSYHWANQMLKKVNENE